MFEPWLRGMSYAVCLLLAAPAAAATFTVNQTADLADAAPGDGVCQTAAGGCTLRAAIEEANALPGLDLILVPAGTFNLDLQSPGTLFITDSVRIIGSRTGATIVDGRASGSVFDIEGRPRGQRQRNRVELHFLTIQNGDAGTGGGIANRGGAVLVSRCVVRGNTAFTEAGGIANGGGGVMSVVRTLVTDNGDPLEGGQIGFPARSGGMENDAGSILYLSMSTLSGNRANRFGGMRNLGILIAQNSTISGNQAEVDTGGLVNTGTAFLNNVTLADNHMLTVQSQQPTSAGGLSNSGVLYFANSIVADNTRLAIDDERQDCFGTLTSFGYNLVELTNGCDIVGLQDGLITGQNPNLGALANNGGDTPTHLLGAGSPARNAGNPAFPTGIGNACEPVDQRFRLRFGPGVGRCDMGAVEMSGAPGEEAAP